MTKASKNNIIISVISLFILYFLYNVRTILLPFTLGIIIAYFLNRITTKLEKIFHSRRLSSIFIIILFTTIILLLIIFLGFSLKLLLLCDKILQKNFSEAIL